MANSKATISIKVFVDKVKKRVVYAEADHSFVDILFSFMAMPMGTIVKLLGKHVDTKFEPLGSLNNLYQSLKDLPECYLVSKVHKDRLLNPRSLLQDHCKNIKLKLDDAEPLKTNQCSIIRLNSNNARVVNRVFVSDVATFIVTDDLFVAPYTVAGCIQLLTSLGITDISHLEGRQLDIGCEQMLYLLKLALSLDSPLTYFVFGRKDYPIRDLFGSFQVGHCDLVNKETSKMLLQVSLQKSTGRVLFVEAKEDFVEFLFGLLSIPLGTVIETLMSGASSIRCMSNIFKSITNMSVGSYLMSQDVKDMLLKPTLGLPLNSKIQGFSMPGTGQLGHYGKFVKQSGMFFVTDDLIVKPSSSYSTMDALIKMKVQLDDIERHEISIDLEEGLGILKASLRSKSSLTSVIEHQLNK